ncbi:MAG: hypothetical protein J6C96_08695 [Oscillospiraceae bacterium]|nr:hypothetical protein [Oscillospiraceae bacterium]
MKKSVFLICILYMTAAAYISSLFYIEPLAHIPPRCKREDISYAVNKSRVDYTDEDYAFIFRQTGLGRPAVDALETKALLYGYQDSYFADIEFECRINSPVSFEERVINSPIRLAPLEEGDVLLTNSSHVLSWRNGHAAICVDAENGYTLEAVVIGKNSKLQSTEKWRDYPNFAVLRLKNADKKERAEIARSAMTYLNNIPYNALVGLLPRKYSELGSTAGTQCAHLVWLAYASHGYDIDSDQGLIVTPDDILESDLFEVVQSYGMG